MTSRADKTVLLVGVGGLGCPAAMVLARAGVGTLRIVDDDVVDESNLHRQILFAESAIGKPKVEEAAKALRAIAPELRVDAHDGRFVPETAIELLAGVDLVVEGSDNFATKFLVADACVLAGVPVIHAAAVRTYGTAFAVGTSGRPCYRCVFEDIPHEHAPNCATAGVLGPVVGVVGALQADLALQALDGKAPFGSFVSYDGLRDVVRRHRISPRSSCPLCTPLAEKQRIRTLDPERYMPQDSCA
jgi:molybdopterin/thiamine biosynthesis adenylyltransferase